MQTSTTGNTMDYINSGNELFGHVAYAFLALSYILTNIFWLRVTAVVSMFLEIVYFSYSGGDLATGIGWTVLFILINAYQLFWLLRDRMSLRLPEAEGPMLREALSELDDAQISRLLKAAEWKDCIAGDKLTTQNKPVDELYFLCSGRVNVEVDKSTVAHLEKGSFVGEIAYLTGNTATATVVVDAPSRVLALSRTRLAKVIASDSHINGIIHQLLGRDLAMKMGRANSRRVLLEEASARV